LWACVLEPNKAVLEPIALKSEFSAFLPQTSIFHLMTCKMLKHQNKQNTSENNKARDLTSAN